MSGTSHSILVILLLMSIHDCLYKRVNSQHTPEVSIRWKAGPNPNFRFHLLLRVCRSVHANLANLIYLVMSVSVMPKYCFVTFKRDYPEVVW